MNKPRISSGRRASRKLLQAITRGLEDVADVEPWTTTFNPGRSRDVPPEPPGFAVSLS